MLKFKVNIETCKKATMMVERDVNLKYNLAKFVILCRILFIAHRRGCVSLWGLGCSI